MASVKAHFPVKTEAAAPVGKGKAAATGARGAAFFAPSLRRLKASQSC